MPISFFSSEVHKNYGTYFNGTRKQIFNQVKKMFHYKEKLYWTLQSKGLIMEEGNENKGFFTSRIDSVLKSDTQTFFHHSSQPTPLPLSAVPQRTDTSSSTTTVVALRCVGDTVGDTLGDTLGYTVGDTLGNTL